MILGYNSYRLAHSDNGEIVHLEDFSKENLSGEFRIVRNEDKGAISLSLVNMVYIKPLNENYLYGLIIIHNPIKSRVVDIRKLEDLNILR